ncbi:STAS domain-containing protein [Alkaliphilus peptidifermentans]|uniref:Anti-sigma factor antagonist n=1 Tax=Alkaliphilus peptidifermentans DSM 18978 TaxID=1120976 RepID=A0A1G5HHD4_9FIRM|nr:STAS domain-containing protein [Alkaliphilus peptidifermentans]SCY63091.1 anti-sigma B factor antagonist [Alkaliphilus peptidifermentans DSM 18978]
MSLLIKNQFDEQQNQWHIELEGEVDIYTSAQLKEAFIKLIEEKKEAIKIDAKNLEYIDSTGLGVLIGALKRLKEYNKDIIIINIKPSIKKLLNITGLDKIFIIEG